MAMSWEAIVNAIQGIATDSRDAFESSLANLSISSDLANNPMNLTELSEIKKEALLRTLASGIQKTECIAVLRKMLRYGRNIDVLNVANAFSNSASGSREDWFYYLTFECSKYYQNTSTSVIEKQNYEVVLKSLFRASPDGGIFQIIPFQNISAMTFKEIMRRLLNFAFRRMPIRLEQVAAEVSTENVTGGFLAWLGAGRPLGLPTEVTNMQVAAVWRGDSRAPDIIKASGGFKAKVRTGALKTSMGLDADWNIFGDPRVKKYLWYRKGQEDNCTRTAVSVGNADSPQAFTVYPLIKQSGGTVQGLSGYRGHVDIMVNLLDANARPVGMGNPIGQISRRFHVSVTYMYLIAISGLILLTNKLQSDGNYPEWGLRRVIYNDIFTCFKCTRYHLGPNDDDGFIAKIEECLSSRGNVLSIATRHGQNILTDLQTKANKLRQAHLEALSWCGNTPGFLKLHLSQIGSPARILIKQGGQLWRIDKRQLIDI